MNNELLSKVPKKYHSAITDIYHDEDGYWCIIGCMSGWKLNRYLSDYTIHEYSFTKVLKVIRNNLVVDNRSDS